MHRERGPAWRSEGGSSSGGVSRARALPGLLAPCRHARLVSYGGLTAGAKVNP